MINLPEIFKNSRSLLVIFLHLVAIHSFFVGIGMIFLHIDIVNYFGFSLDNSRFFLTQGGIFHLVMSIAYIIGAKRIDSSFDFVYFSITAKFIATIFLFSYYLFSESILLILLSGVGDFLMGLCLLILLNRFRKDSNL